jgi:hypothetical protein
MDRRGVGGKSKEEGRRVRVRECGIQGCSGRDERRGRV